MTELTQHRWVQNWHLNASNTLFGGHLLSWVDEDTMMLASLASDKKARYTTAGMERVSFLAPVYLGERVSLKHRIVYVGNTSLWMYSEATVDDQKVFSCFTALVSLATSGKPKPVELLVEVVKDEHWNYVELLRDWQGR